MAEMNLAQQQALAIASAKMRMAQAPIDSEGGIAAAIAPEANPPPAGTDAMDVFAGSLPGRFLLGAASLPMGAAQLQEHIYGNPGPIDRYIQKLEEMKARGQAAAGDEGGLDIAGGVGAAATPVGAGGTVAKGVGLVSKMLRGATTGVGIGAATPVTDTNDFVEKKAGQMAVGGAVGGAFPAAAAPVMWAGKKLYNLIEPYVPGGVEAIAGRAANGIAGDRRGAVVDALLQSKQINPGSWAGPTKDLSTAAEAAVPAGSAEFSALGKLAAQRKPSDYNAIAEEQQNQRAEAVQRIAGGRTGAEQDSAQRAAIKARRDATDPLYEAVKDSKAKVDAMPVLTTIGDLVKGNVNEDAVAKPLLTISEKLLIQGPAGGKPRLENSITNLVSLSRDIGNKISAKNPDGTPAFDVKALSAVKDILDEQIAKVEPAYAAARAKHAEMSVPLNRLQVGAELDAKLNRPTGKESPTSYLTAVDDSVKTVKDATGFRGSSVDKILTPDQLSSVNSVVAELLNKAQNEKLGGLGGPAAQRELATSLAPTNIPSMLDRGVMITRAIFDRLQGKAGSAALDLLAEKMKNPAEMARLMQSATPEEQSAIVKALMQRRVPFIPAAAATTTSRALSGDYTGGH